MGEISRGAISYRMVMGGLAGKKKTTAESRMTKGANPKCI